MIRYAWRTSVVGCGTDIASGGKLIEVRSGITLTKLQGFIAVLTVLAALIAALGASVSAYVSWQSYINSSAGQEKGPPAINTSRPTPNP